MLVTTSEKSTNLENSFDILQEKGEDGSKLKYYTSIMKSGEDRTKEKKS